MKYETSIDIDADPQRIWSILTDVERWPEWTASVVRVERVSSEPFSIGSRILIKQPRLRKAIWTVIALEPLVEFTWKSTMPGLTTIGSHRLEQRASGTMTVTLSIDQRGALAPAIGLFVSKMTRRYMDYERRGLRARSEAEPSGIDHASTEADAGQ